MAIDNTTIAGLAGSERKLEVRVNAIRNETNELVQSGLTATTTEIQALANGGPRKVSLDYIKPLSDEAFNVTNDDINDEGDVGSQEGATFNAHRVDINYAWGTTDLTGIVTQYGRTDDLATGIAAYQNAVSKRLLTSTLKGMKAALASDTTLVRAVATDFDMQAVYDAAASGEEWSDLFRIMLVSHGRYAKMQGTQKGFRAPAETNTRFAETDGYVLLKTNTLTDDEVIIGRVGGLGYGEGTAQQAFEVERKANGGNGGGADILHSRFSRTIHPLGMSYEGGIAKTQAEVKAFLEAAASWELVAPATQFAFRFINFNA